MDPTISEYLIVFSDVQESELRVLDFRKQVEDKWFIYPPETECEMFFENNIAPLAQCKVKLSLLSANGIR